MDKSQLDKNWQDLCSQIKAYNSVDSAQINAFFSRLQPQAMSEGFLMITADNDFIKTWIERHYLDFIKQALLDTYHVPFNVIIEVDPNQSISPSPVPTPTPVPTIQEPTFTAETVTASKNSAVNDDFPVAEEQELKERLDKNYPPINYKETSTDTDDDINSPTSTLTFENFVIGDSNRMAYSMAVEVAEMPGRAHLNPLFIYGKSGLGKTHLMRAIQNYIRETAPQMRTIYVDSSELLSDFTEASAAHDMEKSSFRNFKSHYQEADVLLIDDIQFLQGKRQTLEMVFQIFKKLTEHGKQVVLSADRAPKNIDIDERYHSRFSQGGIIDIQPPEMETKLGIEKIFITEYKKNEGMAHFYIPEDILIYIAENSSSNIRELKSAITKIIYQMQFFNQKDLTIEEVRILLENHFSGGSSRNLSVEDIQREVENFYKIKHNELVGKGRSRQIMHPRHIAIYLCRQLLDLPFNAIAKKFNRDHTTAMHSVDTIEKLLRESREVQEEVETLRHIIREL